MDGGIGLNRSVVELFNTVYTSLRFYIEGVDEESQYS